MFFIGGEQILTKKKPLKSHIITSEAAKDVLGPTVYENCPPNLIHPAGVVNGLGYNGVCIFKIN